MRDAFPREGRYESINPDRKAATLAAEDLSDQDDQDDQVIVARKSTKESIKPVLTPSRKAAALRTVFYLLPVGLSFGILQLSFRRVYWRGSTADYYGHYDINEVLNILQIVAKVHEILIVTSLSHLVLFYLCQQLSSNGLSFGLFTSTYQVTIGSHPLSKGFWEICKSLAKKNTFRWRSLAF